MFLLNQLFTDYHSNNRKYIPNKKEMQQLFSVNSGQTMIFSGTDKFCVCASDVRLTSNAGVVRFRLTC